MMAALAHYGRENQMAKTIEECAELIDALCKWSQGRCPAEAVVTELADVCVMCGQMWEVFGRDAFRREVERKLERLGRRIKEEGGGL